MKCMCEECTWQILSHVIHCAYCCTWTRCNYTYKGSREEEVYQYVQVSCIACGKWEGKGKGLLHTSLRVVAVAIVCKCKYLKGEESLLHIPHPRLGPQTFSACFHFRALKKVVHASETPFGNNFITPTQQQPELLTHHLKPCQNSPLCSMPLPPGSRVFLFRQWTAFVHTLKWAGCIFILARMHPWNLPGCRSCDCLGRGASPNGWAFGEEGHKEEHPQYGVLCPPEGHKTLFQNGWTFLYFSTVPKSYSTSSCPKIGPEGTLTRNMTLRTILAGDPYILSFYQRFRAHPLHIRYISCSSMKYFTVIENIAKNYYSLPIFGLFLLCLISFWSPIFSPRLLSTLSRLSTLWTGVESFYRTWPIFGMNQISKRRITYQNTSSTEYLDPVIWP